MKANPRKLQSICYDPYVYAGNQPQERVTSVRNLLHPSVIPRPTCFPLAQSTPLLRIRGSHFASEREVRSSGFQPLCPSHKLQSVCNAAVLRDLAAWCGRRSVGLSAFNQSLVQVQHATSAETRQSKPKAASLDSSAKPGTRLLSSKQQDFSRSCHRVCFSRNLPSLKN
jgi:hypothetical protein